MWQGLGLERLRCSRDLLVRGGCGSGLVVHHGSWNWPSEGLPDDPYLAIFAKYSSGPALPIHQCIAGVDLVDHWDNELVTLDVCW